MANVSVTHSFTNSTTADATQVNTNFTDIINGTSDGSKDFSISALTCAGNFTANGTTNTLGSASNDDLVINASLASSVPIKTTFTYDVGTSTIGLRSIYFGDAGSAARSTRVIGGTVASSYTITLPVAVGSAGQSVANLGSGSLIFLNDSASQTRNLGLAGSVGSSILTVALKGADGNDPSATNPVYITFRSATATTGTPVIRAVTGALSVQVSSGSTLGHISGMNNWLYVYAIDNAGTVELAVAGSPFVDTNSVVTTTAEGGAGAADSNTTIYSTTARSGVAVRLLGRMLSSQATAGTWASTLTEISIRDDFYKSPRSYVRADTGNGHGSSGTMIRRFTNSTTVGTAITYADSATQGATFTINEDGLYFVEYSDKASGTATDVGISANALSNSTAIRPTTLANGKLTLTTPATGCFGQCSITWPLKAGDIVRAHTDGAPNDNTDSSHLVIIKIAD